MTTYLAITIGPITKTLSMARKTSELWAASYTFAFLMKGIAKKVYEHDQKAQYTGRLWLKPALGQAALDNMQDVQNRVNKRINGVGIFPDNLIFSLRDTKEEPTVRGIIFEVIKDYAAAISAKLAGTTPREVEEYLRNYLQIYWVRKTLDGQSSDTIKEMSDLLNQVEVQKAFDPIKRSYLFDFFKAKGSSSLYDDAFGIGSSQRFESLPEIALKVFKRNLSQLITLGNGQYNCWGYVSNQRKGEPDDDQYIQWVNEFRQLYAEQHPKEPPIPFLSGHKYVAIVQSDGDGIGKLLGKLQTNQVGPFSEALTDFAVKAAEMVKDFGGLPVYFGGDDALFFAPVIAGEGPDKNVFSLLKELDAVFQQYFDAFDASAEKPTLSFGVSIAYYKYPLYESLDQAGKLLHYIGKKGGLKGDLDPTTGKKGIIKNNIVFRLLKHSGSSFGGIIHLNPPGEDADLDYSVLEDFINLLALNTLAPNQALRSIIYRIPQNKALLNEIATDKEALKNWVGNCFDEEPHKKSEAYISDVTDLIYKVYKHKDRYPKELDEEAFGHPDRIVYSLLKTIVFLTTNEA